MKHPQAFIPVGFALVLVLAFAALVPGKALHDAEAAGAVRCNDSSLYFPADGIAGWRYGDPASTDTDAQGNRTAHTGVDIFATDGAGATVYAPAAGMVSRQGGAESLNLILTGVKNGLTGETGIELYVTHITPSLSIGEQFDAGDEIGTQVGDHVHFSVGAFMGFDDRQIDQTQDPSPYFGAALTYDSAATERLDVSDWCDSSISVASITPLPATPTPTPAPSATSTPSASGTSPAGANTAETNTAAADQDYVVQSGDTLGAIAEQFGVSVEAIAEASGIDDVDLLEVGQTLVIPGEGGAAGGTDSEGDASAAPVSETYVVADGDTLSSIAEAFGVTVDDIVTANGLSDEDYISIGQELQIQSGATAGESGSAAETDMTAETGSIEPLDSEYVVVEGDTLSTIAEAHGTDVETLQSLNGIEDASFINVGDVLLLP